MKLNDLLGCFAGGRSLYLVWSAQTLSTVRFECVLRGEGRLQAVTIASNFEFELNQGHLLVVSLSTTTFSRRHGCR